MLSIKRPTSTTVLYTVSTRAPNATPTGRLLLSLFNIGRILAGILAAAVLLLEYERWAGSTITAPIAAWMSDISSALPFRHGAVLLYSHIPAPWRLVICTAVTWLILRKGYTEESLLVIRGLGVQTSTSSPSYLWTSSTRFIPTSSIQDIFLHEAFKGFEVKYYLSIVVEGEEDVVVVFPVGRPDLDTTSQSY